MTRQKILIDTDPGQDIDDLLAIWFALLRPELDVVGVTTVTWPSDRRARMVKRLLRYLDRPDVPVAPGMQYPLRPFSADEVRRQQDLGWSMNHYAFAEPEDPLDDPAGDAVDLIVRTVDRSPGEVALACIGPLTNVACALRRRPDIAPRIHYIAMMGGEVALLRREHNVAFDPVASQIVFTSGVPLFVGTWDVTRRFVLTPDDCRRIRALGTPLARAIGDAIDRWHPAQSWKPGPVMYDAFPIVWSFDRSYYEARPMCVRVETAGEATRGMTVATDGPPNAHVTTDCRAAELRELYLRTIGVAP